MRKLLLLCVLICASGSIVAIAPARATSLRTWVSASGLDTNACTQIAPCQTFAHALTQTTSGGEIDCLSGGDFGPVTITQSVTIDCGAGQVGGIGVQTSGINAITLNLASSGTVVLRNLNLNGFQLGFDGIGTSSFPGGTLVIQHCNIHNFNDSALRFKPTSGRGVLAISDTAIYANGLGVFVGPTTGVIASVVLDRVEITANPDEGLILSDAGVVAGTVRQSVIAANRSDGILAQANQGVFFTVEESSIVDNLSTGIETNSTSANVQVGTSTIGGNGTGVKATSGTLNSFGNNQMSANGSNGTFTGNTPLE